VTGIIELYEDRQSGWRVLARRGGTTGYRFIIVDRAGRSTFAADAKELASGSVPTGLEQVDLDVDSSHGMVLIEPCARWSRGRVRRAQTKPGVLTAAYISGEVVPAASARKRRRPSAEQGTVALRAQHGQHANRRQDPASVDGDEARSHSGLAGLEGRRSVEAALPARGGPPMSETILASKAMVPVHPLRGQHMARTSSNGSTTGRRRRTTGGADTRLVVTQITQLVAANEQLQRANRELTEENQRLRGQLTAIGSALGGLTGGRRGRVRGVAAPYALPEARPRQKRRPITDPEILARRNAALAKARAARAEKLAAARQGSSAAESRKAATRPR
jgi:hypothetical protein